MLKMTDLLFFAHLLIVVYLKGRKAGREENRER